MEGMFYVVGWMIYETIFSYKHMPNKEPKTWVIGALFAKIQDPWREELF